MSSDEVAFPFVALASTPDALALASSSAIHWVRTGTGIPAGEPSSSTSSSTMVVPGNGSFMRQVAISPDGQYVATISDDKGLRVYTYNAETDFISLESTRYLTKKASDLSFTSDGSGSGLLVSDKVGDAYLYPLQPKAIPAEEVKRKKLDVQADPTLNPEATFLLGHVSVLTSHILTDDLDLEGNGTGKKRRVLITADRDEHIRVTRYPDTFVIERYLFGTDGFVSSIHIPQGDRPELLVSGGGEGILRIWDWQAGKQLGTVSIEDAVLPHRAARSTLRKDKRRNKGPKRDQDPFYTVQDGWMLPSGQGICIKNISSVRIGNSTVVLFFSEGAAAIHSFVLPADLSSSSTIPASAVQSLPTQFPVLDYALVPGTSDQILVSLDTTFGTVAFNQDPSSSHPKGDGIVLTAEQKDQMAKPFRVVQIGADGSLSDITSSSSLITTLDSLRITADKPSSLSNLNLYPNLSLYPRWPGLEEDDDLAGPDPAGADAGEASPAAAAPAGRKEYTQEEYAAMNLKTLGRLKSQGYNVEAVMKVKRRETKDRRYEAKRRRVDAGLSEPSKEEQELAADVDAEGAGEAEAEAAEEEGLNA